MGIERMAKWYQRRHDIMRRRIELGSQMSELMARVEAFFAGFDVDPMTGRRPFSVSLESPNDYPGGVVTVRFESGQGSELKIGLPALETNISVTPGRVLEKIGVSGGVERLTFNSDSTELTFRVAGRTTRAIDLEKKLLPAWTDIVFR